MAEQLQFRFGIQPWTEESPQVVAHLTLSESPPSRPEPTSWPPDRRKKPSSNIASCIACGDEVAMINRRGIKLAWTEETVTTKAGDRTLYWCQPCAETGTIETLNLENIPIRRRVLAS